MGNLAAMGAHLDIILCGALPMLLTMCERTRMKEFKAYRLLMHLRCKEAKMPPQASKGLSYAAIFGMPVFVYFMPTAVGQCALLLYTWILWRSMKAEKAFKMLADEERIAWKVKEAERHLAEMKAMRDAELKLLEEQQKERAALAAEMLEEAIRKNPELEVLRGALEEIKKNS